MTRKNSCILLFATFLTALFSSCRQYDAKEMFPRTPDVHFVPTAHDVVDVMLRLADIKKNDIVYDLGCGDGRIVIAAAKKVRCKAWGFDIDHEMVIKSRENVRKEKLHRLVTIEQKDIFELDLSKATVITLFLLPHLNVRLIPQLEKLKDGTRIVSHAFEIAGIKPDVVSIVNREDGGKSHVYLYTTPLKRVETDEEEEGHFEQF